MGLVHVPRAVLATFRGNVKRLLSDKKERLPGLSKKHPHIYRGRVGLFDFDHCGHMNNSAYLVHAELARWEMTARAGMFTIHWKENAFPVRSTTVIRYRRQIRIFREFKIDTYFCALDERSMWIKQAFRYPGSMEKIRAQVLTRSSLVYEGKVVDPRVFYHKKGGFDATTIDRLDRTGVDDALQKELSVYEEMQELMKLDAAADDERLEEEGQ